MSFSLQERSLFQGIQRPTAGPSRRGPLTSGAGLPGVFQVGDRRHRSRRLIGQSTDDHGEGGASVPRDHLSEPAERQSAEEVMAARRQRPAAPRAGTAWGIRRRAGQHRAPRPHRGGTSASDASSPRPPAKAISASATARPPSLRSWQARTRPRLIAAMDRAEEPAVRSAGRPAGRGLRRVRGLIAQCDPPSSQPRQAGEEQQVAGFLQIHRHACRTSGTWPIALIRRVGGMARLLPSCVYSLLRLSLPEMNGVP